MASFQLTQSFHCLCCPSSTFLFSLVVDQMYLEIQDSPERKVCSKSYSQGTDHCDCGEHHLQVTKMKITLKKKDAHDGFETSVCVYILFVYLLIYF